MPSLTLRAAAALFALGAAAEALSPTELAIIVDASQPESVQAGHYYATARKIPRANIFPVSFGQRNNSNVVDNATFSAERSKLWSRLGPNIQALALMWTEPMRVDCMSVTSAFAFGFDDRAWCMKFDPKKADPCYLTKASPYYNSSSEQPFTDFGVRPAMLVAGATFKATQALIDRGVSADGTRPNGTGWLIKTNDTIRNVRYKVFEETVSHFKGQLDLRYIDASAPASAPSSTVEVRVEVEAPQKSNKQRPATDEGAHASSSVSPILFGKSDVMFYFESLAVIPDIWTNSFRPGAIGDTLTSVAGHPNGGESCYNIGPHASDQTSVMCFLEAGAAASYGNVEEPCNDQQKFSQTLILLESYTGGATLIESYWRSVMMPGMGVFVGEPLARPFAAPPDTGCNEVLGAACGRAQRASKGDCFSCVASHQQQLQQAGCGQSDIDRYCTAASSAITNNASSSSGSGGSSSSGMRPAASGPGSVVGQELQQQLQQLGEWVSPSGLNLRWDALENVIMSPNAAEKTLDYWRRAAVLAAERLDRLARSSPGERPRC